MIARRIYGVDFSGAADAGRKIWIAAGRIEGGGLLIDDCVRGEALPDSSRDRARCLSALRSFIAASGEAIFGLDFPFGLPRAVVKDDRWDDFARLFAERYATPQQFRRACFEAANGRELRRVTDVASKTPFSPYNLRLYRQTFYGLRDLIGPLVADSPCAMECGKCRAACALPMQRARAHVPWLIEICPASTLKRLNLYHSYKGKTIEHRTARSHILRSIQHYRSVTLSPAIRTAVVDDAEGDALDSVIAALAAFRMLRGHERWPASMTRIYRREGYVFV